MRARRGSGRIAPSGVEQDRARPARGGRIGRVGDPAGVRRPGVRRPRAAQVGRAAGGPASVARRLPRPASAAPSRNGAPDGMPPGHPPGDLRPQRPHPGGAEQRAEPAVAAVDRRAAPTSSPGTPRRASRASPSAGRPYSSCSSPTSTTSTRADEHGLGAELQRQRRAGTAGASQCAADRPPVAAPIPEVSAGRPGDQRVGDLLVRGAGIGLPQAGGVADRQPRCRGGEEVAEQRGRGRGRRPRPPAVAAGRRGSRSAGERRAHGARHGADDVAETGAAERGPRRPAAAVRHRDRPPTSPADGVGHRAGGARQPDSSAGGAAGGTGRGGGTSRPARSVDPLVHRIPPVVPSRPARDRAGQAAQSRQYSWSPLVAASRLRCWTRKQREQVNSSSCLGSTRTVSSSLDRSAPGQLEVLVEVGLVDVDRRGLRLGAPGLELLERVLAELVGLVAARGVVVGGHGVPLLRGSRGRRARSSDAAPGCAPSSGPAAVATGWSGSRSPVLGLPAPGVRPPSPRRGGRFLNRQAPQRRAAPVCARSSSSGHVPAAAGPSGPRSARGYPAAVTTPAGADPAVVGPYLADRPGRRALAVRDRRSHRRGHVEPDLRGDAAGRRARRRRGDPAAAPDRRRAGHRARHGPRAPGHLRARRHRRAGPPDAAPVHRRVGARRAVLRDGAGRRAPRRPGASRPGYADRPDAAPRGRRAARRRAGRPALGRLRAVGPRRVRPAGGVRRPPGAPLDQAVGGDPRPRPPGPRRPGRPPGRDGARRRAVEHRARRLPAGQLPARPRRARPDQGRPRLGDVDPGRSADRPRHDVRLLAGGRRGARVHAQPGHHAAGLPHPPRGRRAVRAAHRRRPLRPALVRRRSPSSSSPRSSPGSSPGRPPARWPARTRRATRSASIPAWSWDAPRWTTVRSRAHPQPYDSGPSTAGDRGLRSGPTGPR